MTEKDNKKHEQNVVNKLRLKLCQAQVGVKVVVGVEVGVEFGVEVGVEDGVGG